MSIVKFTFQDWLEDRFVMEYTMYGGTHKPTNRNYGELVLNDSSKYQFLVFSERMDMETWNQIQLAQADAYKRMVSNHLAFLKATFSEKVAAIRQQNPVGITKRIAELKALLISDIEKFKEKYPVQYEAIAYLTQPRGTPVGAKFVTAQQYKNPLQYPNLHVANDGASIDPARMMPGEMEYLLMDAALKFRDYLENGQAEASDIEKLDSAPVLGKLLALDEPNTKGEKNVEAWLVTKLNFDTDSAKKKARAVYNEFRNVKGVEDVTMVKSINHLEKLVQFIDVNPQFKRHSATVNRYLKTATAHKKNSTLKN